MKLEKWKQLIQKTNIHDSDFYNNFKNAHIEMEIVNSYMKKNRDRLHFYDDAEKELSEQNKIIKDIELIVHDMSDDRCSDIEHMSNMGRYVIDVFNQNPHLKIRIKDIDSIDPAAIGGWFGSPWDKKLNFHELRKEYKKSQKRFQFDGVGRGSDGMVFRFGYQGNNYYD